MKRKLPLLAIMLGLIGAGLAMGAAIATPGSKATRSGLGSISTKRFAPVTVPAGVAKQPSGAAAQPATPAQAPPAQKAPAAAPATAAKPLTQAKGAEFADLPESLRVNGQPAPEHIKAISRERLVLLARESAGREDPFVSLINPPAGGYPAAPYQAGQLSRPPELHSLPVPSFPGGRAPRLRTENGLLLPAPNLAGGLNQGALDSAEPAWTVNGILNTGREAVALLELNGVNREAKAGEVLEDGSQVVKIESSQVILQKRGRRYPKRIGGQDEGNE